MAVQGPAVPDVSRDREGGEVRDGREASAPSMRGGGPGPVRRDHFGGGGAGPAALPPLQHGGGLLEGGEPTVNGVRRGSGRQGVAGRVGGPVERSDSPRGPVRYPRFTGGEPCVEVGTEVFFLEEDAKSRGSNRERMLRDLCHRCPMLDPCAGYALRVRVTGWWGGMSEIERDRVRRDRGIVPGPVFE
jgi:hypothetical protein